MSANGSIFSTKKGMQKVYKKLLAHPLFISDYVVYYARAFFINERSLECVCVCVCVTQLFELRKPKVLKDAKGSDILCTVLLL